jgi:hypothetical protein
MATTLTARRPEDLLAAVPVVLGFRPFDSLVMLTFETARPFHARIDLPPPDEVDNALPEITDALLSPCLAQRVGRVVLVLFTADARLAARVAAPVRRAFVREGVDVFEVLRAHEGRWCQVAKRPGAREQPTKPYDDKTHPFAAQAVFEGLVTRSSREEVRASVEAWPEGRASVAALLADLGPPGEGDLGWSCELVRQCTSTGAVPDDGEAARLLTAISRMDVRDAVIDEVRRPTAREHVRVWSDLLRRAPDETVAEAAAVTAFCAWQAGDGALAWCALDRCLDAEPDHRLGLLLAECLAGAVPPHVWEGVRGPEPADTDTA